jgi:hypothetical protein
MRDEDRPVAPEIHRRLAIDLNQLTWRLLEAEKRTPDEADEMLQAAYASCYHWRQAGTPREQARGHWLISRVCVVLACSQAALYHAGRSLAICEQHGYGDFDMAYAYEAMARAAAAAGRAQESAEYQQFAQKAGEAIAGDEDRKLFFSDFAANPWFGLR